MNTPKVPTENPRSRTETSAEKSLRLTPRQARVLSALEGAKGWIWREDIDRIAGASNGPDIVMELRRKVTGHDGIDLERVDRIDRDGRPCHPGRYRLNEIGRRRLARSAEECHG